MSGGIAATVLITFIAGFRWKTDNDIREDVCSALEPLRHASFMTWPSVLTGCALIGIGAVVRFLSERVFSCCSEFNIKEQLVLALSLFPKATVQVSLNQ
ncbi:hypothetical protein COOONC_00936 [Cooperia oncophora]